MCLRRFARVVGIDQSEIMLETARETAALNSIGNAEFMLGKVSDAQLQVTQIDAIVASVPPRRCRCANVMLTLLRLMPATYTGGTGAP